MHKSTTDTPSNIGGFEVLESVETIPDSSRRLITRNPSIEYPKKKKKLQKRMTKAEILVFGIPPDYF
jgi:hypothetical protein